MMLEGDWILSLAGAACTVLLATWLTCYLYFRYKCQNQQGLLPGVPKGAKILLLTAHPDDEAMFFVPTIAALRQNYEWHVLCLSTGTVSLATLCCFH